MLPSNFEVLSTLWCLIERPHEDPNLADFRTHDGRMSLWVGRGMSLCKGSLAECLGCQAVPIRTPRLKSSATALPPSWETQWQASPETFYILPQQKKFSMFAQKQPSYIVLRLPRLLTIMGPTWNCSPKSLLIKGGPRWCQHNGKKTILDVFLGWFFVGDSIAMGQKIIIKSLLGKYVWSCVQPPQAGMILCV